MSRTAAPDLSCDARRLVLAILADHLPANAKVWVCGSRATGRARRYSDLDLAIDAGRRLTLDETARLADAFRDSDLPTGSILSIGTASPSGFGRLSPPIASPSRPIIRSPELRRLWSRAGVTGRRWSRRGLMQTALAAATLACRSRLAMARAQVSQAEAQYQDQPKGGFSCAACALFRPPAGCVVVAGTISPHGWCRFFDLPD